MPQLPHQAFATYVANALQYLNGQLQWFFGTIIFFIKSQPPHAFSTYVTNAIQPLSGQLVPVLNTDPHHIWILQPYHLLHLLSQQKSIFGPRSSALPSRPSAWHRDSLNGSKKILTFSWLIDICVDEEWVCFGLKDTLAEILDDTTDPTNLVVLNWEEHEVVLWLLQQWLLTYTHQLICVVWCEEHMTHFQVSLLHQQTSYATPPAHPLPWKACGWHQWCQGKQNDASHQWGVLAPS